MISNLGVTMTFVALGLNHSEEWKGQRYSFVVTLAYAGRSMECDYHMGTGHAKKGPNGEVIPPKPELAEVLESLFSDADCASSTFEDFCSDLGYDSDSRKALALYLACQKQGTKLHRLLSGSYDDVRKALRDEIEGDDD